MCCEACEDMLHACSLTAIAIASTPKTVKHCYNNLQTCTKLTIDENYYPIEEAKRSNMRHRPIGMGVQGLADAFILMRFPFDSPQAAQLNKVSA
jgi:Ribonucleotide reductase, barrel domain